MGLRKDVVDNDRKKETFIRIKGFILLLGSVGSLVVGIKVGWDIVKEIISKMASIIFRVARWDKADGSESILDGVVGASYLWIKRR